MAGREQQEEASRRLTPRKVGELGTEILVHENTCHKARSPFETPFAWTKKTASAIWTVCRNHCC